MVLQTVICETSVADPYHFDTDPDSGCEKIRYGSGFRVNFDTDPDPGKNDTVLDPDPGINETDPDQEKRPKYEENFNKLDEKT